MPEQLLETFRGVYRQAAEAFNDGDLERALGGLPTDFEWHAPSEDLDHAVHRGPVEIRRWFEELRAVFADWRMELREFEQPSQQAVLVHHVISGRSRGAGVPVDVHTYELWEFAEMRPIRARQYLTREEALAAADA